jgi:hypothetical protein
MSAPMAAEVLRELGARTRTFRSIPGLMTWWTNQRALRDARAISMEVGGAPASREKREEAQATYALITRCMVERDPDFDLEDWPLSSWRVEALAAWYASSEERGKTFMADRLGWSIEVAQRFMDETASVLARRMRGRGLIENDD